MSNINAKEKNGKWQGLVNYCLTLYKESRTSKYREATIESIRESIEAYDQVEKKTNDPWDGACYHKDVEILTEGGWKLVSGVGVGEKVYSREPKTGRIELKPITETHKYKAPSDGLVLLSNLYFNIQVTGNHKFHLEQHKNKKEWFSKEVTADEILTGFTNQGRWKVPLSGKWDAEPGISLWGYDPKDFLSLLGWYISEGWAFKSRTIGIGQSEKANPANVEEIKHLLDRMGLSYKFNKTQFSISLTKSLTDHLADCGKSYKKRIPRMYLGLPPEQLKPLFDTLIKGDGSECWAKDKHRNHPKTTYFTTSSGLADDFQELCLKLGYSASITEKAPCPGGKIRGRRITGKHTQYTVSVRYINFSRFRHDRCTLKKVPYTGFVYCVTVPPHHTVYVRQNGKPLWSGNSNITLPLTTISNDNLAPRLVSGLVGKQPYVRFEMENDQEQDDNTKIIETFFNQELQDVVGIESTAVDIGEKVLKEGTVYPMPRYDLDEEVKKDFMFVAKDLTKEQEAALIAMTMDGKKPTNVGGVWVGGDGQPLLKETTETVFEGGKVELVPFKDIFIPDDAEDWEKTPVIRKVYPTYAELKDYKESRKGYRNIGEWLLKEEGERKLTQDQQSEDQEWSDIQVTSKEVIECIECYIRYIYQEEDQEKEDIKNWQEERYIAQIALDRKILIRLIPLREINFKNQHLIKRIAMFRRQGKSYGMPLHSKIKSIQKGASKTFNMAINIAEIVMIPWFLYTDKVGFRGKETKLKPGQGINVDDISGLYFPKFSINPSQMFQYIEVWMTFWERVVSIGDVQMGLPDAKKTTATEVLAVIEEGNIKHNYQSKPLREDFIVMIRTIYDLYYQHMPLEKTFLYNEKQVPIKRADMARPFKFRLTGSTEMSNKLIERRENEDVYNKALADPWGVFDPVEVTEDYLKAAGKTNTQRLINPTLNQIGRIMKEIPQAEEIFQQAMQQAMQVAKES